MADSIKEIRKDNIRFFCVPGYDSMLQDITRIQQIFSSESGLILHDARNVIKEIPLNNLSLVIKSFRVPGIWGRVMYTLFRSSKAKRSFEYSLKLKGKGVGVPAPVAYVEYYETSLIKKSFYLAEKFSYDCTLHEVLRKEIFSCEDVLPEVARFAFDMHQKGFLHLDFSPGNILVKKHTDGFQLAMVDVNRMHFGVIDFDQGLKGFTRLLRDQNGVSLLASAYAECAQKDKTMAVKTLQRFYQQYAKSTQLLQRVKSPIKRLLGRS